MSLLQIIIFFLFREKELVPLYRQLIYTDVNVITRESDWDGLLYILINNKIKNTEWMEDISFTP